MKIITLIWKDLLNRFSSRVEILFFLILPVGFTYLLGGVGGQGGPETRLVLLIDQDQSSLSAGLLKTLQADDSLEIRLVTAAKAQEAFDEGDAVALVTVRSGFEDSLLNGGSTSLDLDKLPNDTRADAAERAIWAAARRVDRTIQSARVSLLEAERRRAFASDNERQDYFIAQVQAAQASYQAAPRRVALLWAASSAVSYDERAQASAGQMVTWALIPLLGTSVLFAYERNGRTLQRLITTPTRKSTYLLGTITGQFLLGLVQMTILIIFGIYVMKVSWGGSALGLLVVMAAFSLASVAIGTTMGTFIKSERQANNLSIMIGMMLALLGGCWWPIEMFPSVMQQVARAMPTYWAMQGFRDLAARGLSLPAILPEATILLGFAFVFFLVGLLRFRYE